MNFETAQFITVADTDGGSVNSLLVDMKSGWCFQCVASVMEIHYSFNRSDIRCKIDVFYYGTTNAGNIRE